MTEMQGSGRKNCPVTPCETMNYRGSKCSAQRAKFGLGDPMTNADSIRAMNDEQLSMFLWRFDREELARESDCVITRVQILKWLQQPAKEEA